MSRYRLTIERIEPPTEEELERYRLQQQRFDNYPQMGALAPPSSGRVMQCLSVEVSDEEFAAIKRAALEVFK